MKLEVERRFTLAYPGPAADAAAYLRDARRSLEHVTFIRDLRVDGDEVRADLRVEVPFLGEQRLDFHSRIVPRDGGADLVALERGGRAWAEVSGEGRAADAPGGARIDYRLRVVVHLSVPAGDKWGGRAFAKMAEATAARTLARVAEEFPAGVTAGMPRRDEP